ncbi:MAG: hypothetical protein ABIS27_09260, partial [Longimicrobiales bacterium]
AWTATVGGGSFSPASGITDAVGIMGSTWVLGSLPGANGAVAAGSNPRPFWPGRPGVWGSTSFAAIAVAPPVYHAAFMAPLGTATIGSQNAFTDLTPSLTVCALSAGACVQTVATFATVNANASLRGYQINWNTPATLPRGFYRVTASVQGNAIGSIDIEGVLKQKKLESFQFEVGRTLPIKFSIEP